MANLDRPMGFRPVSNGIAGTAPRISQYVVDSTLSTAIYEGDMVYKYKLGVISVADSTDTTEVRNIVGVAAHYVGTDPGAGTKVAVYDDPEQKFIVQVDDNAVSTAALLQELIGFHGRIIPTTGGVTTLQSKMELDGSSLTSTAVTATETWNCIQFLGIDSLSVSSGSWADAYVRIRRTHHFSGGGASAVKIT